MAVAAGDPDAGVRVAALYEAHGRTVLGLCRFLLRDPGEAEDAAQQSFLSAYRSLLGGTVPREPAAWLTAIARNECWARIRRRMREPLALHEVPSELPDPLELAVRNADLDALRSGLEELSPPQREAFLLREFAGLSYGELATALGVTEPAVDSLLFRARTRLRRVLGGVNGMLLPVALRDQLAQLIPGFDQPATGTLARLASLPIAAKLAAAGAGAVIVVAGSAGLGRHAALAHRDSVAATADRAVAAPRRSSRVAAAPRRTEAAKPLRIVAAVAPRSPRPAPAVAQPRRARTARDDRTEKPGARERSVSPTAAPQPLPSAGEDPGTVELPSGSGDSGGAVLVPTGGTPPPETTPTASQPSDGGGSATEPEGPTSSPTTTESESQSESESHDSGTSGSSGSWSGSDDGTTGSGDGSTSPPTGGGH